MMNKTLKSALACIGASAVGAAMATGSINTVPSWNGTSNASPFGEGDTATFGQSITTDAAGGLLQSFTFYLGPLDLDIRAYVYEWDGIKAVGSALFSSSVFNIGEQFAGYKPVVVSTPGIALAPSKKYVMFISSSGLQAGRFNTNAWGALTTNAYAGGEFVFHNSADSFASLFAGGGWDCGDGCGFFGNGADLAFQAQIAALPAVPEPTTYGLMFAGLVAIGARLTGRRR